VPAHRLTLRALGGLVLFAALAGSSPGNIRGCNSDLDEVPVADFCDRFLTAQCQRDLSAGRISQNDFIVCAADVNIAARCESFTVPCPVRPGAADLCITLLLSTENLSIETPELLATRTECNICN
jgi:hypothetical protein